MDYGYIRVSSMDQNEDRQRLAMEQEAIPKRNIYMDKQSGKDFDRPQYKRLVHRLTEDHSGSFTFQRHFAQFPANLSTAIQWYA